MTGEAEKHAAQGVRCTEGICFNKREGRMEESEERSKQNDGSKQRKKA